MDRAQAQQWLDDYVAAWKSYDAQAIGNLFADDIVYRFLPYEEPVTGRADVVKAWLGELDSDVASTRDEPGTYDGSYAPFAVDGDAVVATGRSSYSETPGGPVTQVFHNCFVIRYDDQGRATEFTEYYMKQPQA